MITSSNLNMSLSEQRVIAIRHGIVELHAKLQTLSTEPLVQHYTATNANTCSVMTFLYTQLIPLLA